MPRQREGSGGTTLPRRQLGKALREARDALGYTLQQVSEALDIGKSTLSRLELGQNVRVKPREIEYICSFYELPPEKVEHLKSLAEQASTKSWWQGDRDLMAPGFDTYVDLEASANHLRFFQSLIVPGLLQTADYARSLGESFYVPETPEEIDRRVALRMRRASIITRQTKPVHAEFVLHESLLRTLVGSRQIMADQMRHLADLSTRENIVIRILQHSAGFPVGAPLTPFIVLDFPQSRGSAEPPIVYTESPVGTMFFEEEGDVKRFREMYDILSEKAMDDVKSRDFLRKMAKAHSGK
ncbi:helix-turn-helix domain-containing protein [Nocardia mexicana]|uniref:Helix-turn-helix protein n=1 Tax=Nocardia mexicana TaxID=279262 RepID=A0A370GKQ2_9NOCA|nr:helix-turn-helix transcriptional regulator [Nocardia mexicana]RDI43859.1 helix-turn-helix protein [Nocardia mexicana]